MHLEYPPRPEGSVTEQLRQLWAWLYRLTERLNAEQNSIQESGALNQGDNLQINAGPGLGTGGQVPYHQVVAEYQEAAAQAMSRMALPEQEQQWVNDYFAALTDE